LSTRKNGPEVRGQRTDDGRRRSEDRKEDRGERIEDRGQMSDVGVQRADMLA